MRMFVSHQNHIVNLLVFQEESSEEFAIVNYVGFDRISCLKLSSGRLMFAEEHNLLPILGCKQLCIRLERLQRIHQGRSINFPEAK